MAQSFDVNKNILEWLHLKNILKKLNMLQKQISIIFFILK